MYTYFHPITVRYRDLDHQGHVNNAVYLTYIESARLGYYEASGIWQADSGKTTGMVVARIEIDYLAPIFPGQKVQVGIRISHMGTKSMTFDYQIESGTGGMIFARGKSIMVTYDNQKGESIPIPQDWREKITHFEAQEEHNETA
jgi:acyl-CoA thioester hydrolase